MKRRVVQLASSLKPRIRLVRRHVKALAAVGVLIAAGIVVSAPAAQAAAACEVTYRSNYWLERPGAGGFQASITITNVGDPVQGWTLGFTLAPGQSFQSGWSANWTGSTGAITASSLSWNANLGPGQSTVIGFVGRWSGDRSDPITFRLNGVTCNGGQPNQPPTATLTSPAAGAHVPLGSTLRMSATASDPDGTVQVVQFFVGNSLVGTDSQAPYEVSVATTLIGAGTFSAFARAFDNGSPPRTGDSALVPFTVVTVPPLSIIAEPTALSVTEGGTGSFQLRLSASGASATVGLTVADAPGVTVSPTSVVLGPTQPTQQVTVTAAPGTGGSVATVTAAADPSQQIGSARVTVTVLDAPGEPVANPYQGAAVYVDPDWAAQAQTQAAATPGDLGRQMARAATYPTAVWLDSIASITAGRGLAGHLNAARAQQQAAGGAPMVVQLVLHNVPGRDCMQRGAPGELTVQAFDQGRYRTQFIDQIVAILARPEYAGLRVAVIVEPGALPSLILAQPGRPFPSCVDVTDAYTGAVRYALTRLGSLDNTYTYLDFSYSAFFGYPDNGTPAAQLYAAIVMGAGGPGAASVNGFVTNVRQYAPLTEPLIPNPDLLVGGQPVWQTRFFDFNREIHEVTFAQRARNLLIQQGFPPTIGMLVDTSRNGWGGPDRPTQASTSTDANTFVDASRIDRRPNRGSWCNQVGAGIGARPQATPLPGVHAYVWATPPGLSDGVADPLAPADPDRPFLRHREQCDPRWQAPQGALIPSNALAGAPHFGRWFPDFFAQLVQNAYPPLPVA